MRYLRRFRRRRSTLPSDASISAKPDAITSGASDQSLEDSEHRLGTWESICGLLVAAGVVLEYGPKFIVFIHNPTLANLRDLAGGLLIAIGVAGEIIFASLAGSRRDKLRQRHVLRIADLNLKAEQEHRARIELQAFLAGRDLTPAHFRLLTERLSGFRGLSAVIVKTVDGYEAERFSQSLWLALVQCEWQALQTDTNQLNGGAVRE